MPHDSQVQVRRRRETPTGYDDERDLGLVLPDIPETMTREGVLLLPSQEFTRVDVGRLRQRGLLVGLSVLDVVQGKTVARGRVGTSVGRRRGTVGTGAEGLGAGEGR